MRRIEILISEERRRYVLQFDFTLLVTECAIAIVQTSQYLMR